MKISRLMMNFAVAVSAMISVGQLRCFVFGQALDLQIVENQEVPKYSGRGAPGLLFAQELSIPLEGRRYSFDVDDEGNIYLLDTREASVSVYDKSGKTLAQFGRKGQGPGEFENPVYLAVSKEKKIHIVDRTRRRILVFNNRGILQGHQDLSSMGQMASLVFDSRNFAYITDNRNLFALKDDERIKRGVTALGRLRIFDDRFEKWTDVETWDNLFMKRDLKGGAVPLLYHDIFYYQIDREDHLYIGHSSRYEIRRLSLDGKVERIIGKRARRIPTTKKDRTSNLEKYPDLKDSVMAEAKPFFLDFHVIDKIGLLVGTYEEEWNERRTLVCDLFDPDGVYIAKVEIPRYYTKDHDILSEQRNRLFKNGYCYSIVYNDKLDSLELVRHSVKYTAAVALPAVKK